LNENNVYKHCNQRYIFLSMRMRIAETLSL
jgi:hypothetical protein